MTHRLHLKAWRVRLAHLAFVILPAWLTRRIERRLLCFALKGMRLEPMPEPPRPTHAGTLRIQ